MHFQWLDNGIRSEMLRLVKLEYQIGFCTLHPPRFYINLEEKKNHKFALKRVYVVKYERESPYWEERAGMGWWWWVGRLR